MSRFDSLTLEQKLRAIIVGVAAVLLLTVTLYQSFSATKRSIVDSERYARAIARVVANNAKTATIFDDRFAANEITEALANQDDVIAAHIYDLNGELLAEFIRSEAPHEAHSLTTFNLSTELEFDIQNAVLVVAEPIKNGARTEGKVVIEISVQETFGTIRNGLIATACLLLLSLAVAYPISAGLARRLLRPVAELRQTMLAVSKSGDFSLRAQKHSVDEIGYLVERFNYMLDQLEDRDERIKTHQASLQREVDERTSSLRKVNSALQDSVRDLSLARDAAEHASKAKGEFLANMSHEIRSPLNGVIGMAELLSHTELSERQSHFCSNILSSSRALLGVLNDVLDLSKIEAGGMELENIDFDLVDLLEEVTQLFVHAASQKGLELNCTHRLGRQYLVRGDAMRLRQILINLLSNSVKFTQQGEIELAAEVRLAENNSINLQISVRDTGMGMDDATQTRIFEAFVQADGSMSRRFGGTGLGLAITKRLIDLMGGSITISSAPDKGSDFRLALTLQAAMRSGAPKGYAIANAEVLLIDDQQSAVERLRQRLESWGVQCNFMTGAEALTAINRKQLLTRGAIILNHEMKQQSSGALINALASFSAHRYPILLLTSISALAGPGWQQSPLVHKIIVKPIRQSELFNALNAALGSVDPKHEDGKVMPRKSSRAQRILLAEDNLINQEVAFEHLNSMGYEVVIANNGAEAEARFIEAEFSLVLMDCQMPVADGYEAARAIRALEAQRGGRRTPIVALTANALKGDREKCIAVGMDDFLSKPFRAEDLERVIKHWIVATNNADPATSNQSSNNSDSPITLQESAAWKQLTSMDKKSSGLLERIVSAFETDAQVLQQLLVPSSAVQTEMRQRQKFQAHRMKSASATLGATKLSSLLTHMESLCSSEAALTQIDVDHIQRELIQVLRSIRATETSATAPITQERPHVPVRTAMSTPRDNASTASVKRVPPNDDANRPRLHVVLADDDIATREVVQAWLTAEGYRVSAVPDGEDVLPLIEREKVDFLLLDVMMPKCDGFETCERVRAHPRGSHIPVVMLTGLDDTESIHRAYEVGATDFLAKPVAEVLLSQRLRYIQRSQQATEALRLSEERSRRAQFTARVSYWEWDPESRLMLLGDGLLQMLGLSSASTTMPAAEFARFFAAKDRAVIDAAISDDLPLSPMGEYEITTHDGAILLVEQSIERLTDPLSGRRRTLGTLQDITERRANENRIYQMSHFDSLTGLPNLEFLRKSLTMLLRLADRTRNRVGYLTIDVGRHEQIATTLGADARDSYLLRMVDRLRDHLRASDLSVSFPDPEHNSSEEINRAAIVAGNRFVIVLNNVHTPETITRVCQRLTDTLAKPVDLGSETIFPQVAIGISQYPDDGIEFDDLHQRSLTALNQLTANNETGFQWYLSERHAQERARISMERDLRFALERNELEVHYQPRIDASTCLPIGMEALARWRVDGKWISPGVFIPIAEEAGLITQLGEFVLRNVIAQVSVWRRKGLQTLKASVNVSARQFFEGDFPTTCARLLDEHGLDAEALELELTEAVLIEANPTVLEQLTRLRALGVSIALDDFGTGFSSLAYLTKFPINVLKIDRSFVDRLPVDRNSTVIVSSTLSLAKDLGMTTVAEGVETQAQADWLIERNCNELQGFLFSPALPPAKFEDWVLGRIGQLNVVANAPRPSLQ